MLQRSPWSCLKSSALRRSTRVRVGGGVIGGAKSGSGSRGLWETWGATPETKAENLPHRLLQGFPLVLVLHLGYALPRLTPAIRHGAFGTLARFVSSQVGSGSCQPGLLKIDMSSTPQIAHPGGNERKIPWC